MRYLAMALAALVLSFSGCDCGGKKSVRERLIAKYNLTDINWGKYSDEEFVVKLDEFLMSWGAKQKSDGAAEVRKYVYETIWPGMEQTKGDPKDNSLFEKQLTAYKAWVDGERDGLATCTTEKSECEERESSMQSGGRFIRPDVETDACSSSTISLVFPKELATLDLVKEGSGENYDGEGTNCPEGFYCYDLRGLGKNAKDDGTCKEADPPPEEKKE